MYKGAPGRGAKLFGQIMAGLVSLCLILVMVALIALLGQWIWNIVT